MSFLFKIKVQGVAKRIEFSEIELKKSLDDIQLAFFSKCEFICLKK